MTGFCNDTTLTCREAQDQDYCEIGGDGWEKLSPEIGETDVDCGGPGCARLGNLCNDTKRCIVGSDCESGQCYHDDPMANDGRCTSCANGWRDGAETSIDCGGEWCGPCADKKACRVDADCSSASCDESGKTCRSCKDNEKNGNETDIDCGGQTGCERCLATGTARACVQDSDCASNRCLQNKCVSFFNNLTDIDESDVDCGMAAPKKCLNSKKCLNASDCVEGYCQGSDGTCQNPPASVHCSNGEQDVEYGETDVDCGGLRCSQNVSRCGFDKMCAEPRDCESGLCTIGWSRTDTSSGLRCASCNDNVQNARESDIDCGGSEEVALTALFDMRIKTRFVQNEPGQFERKDDLAIAMTSTGGTTCSRCNDTKKCRVNSDCKSGMCFPTVATNFTGESPTLHKIAGQSF